MQLQPVVPIPFSPSRHAPIMSVSRSPPGQYHGMSPSPINGSSPVGSLNHHPYMNGPKPNGVAHFQDPNMVRLWQYVLLLTLTAPSRVPQPLFCTRTASFAEPSATSTHVHDAWSGCSAFSARAAPSSQFFHLGRLEERTATAQWIDAQGHFAWRYVKFQKNNLIKV